MAGRGPAPKDSSAGPFDVLAAFTGDAPKLPVSYRVSDGHREVSVRYLASTRAWWAAWCASPQASRFAATDWQRLRMIAPLVDRFERTSARELAAEIRQQEGLLGATPVDRLRLRWKIAEPDEKPAEENPREARRRHLRAAS